MLHNIQSLRGYITQASVTNNTLMNKTAPSKLSGVRRGVALVIFLLITLLFLDFTGTIHTYFGWLAKIQFIPAILALHFAVVIALIALTLIFGRIYCSVICPLGVFQDIISRSATSKKKRRFKYRRPLTILRVSVLIIFVAMFIMGMGQVVALLEPYSAYGRIASNLFAPIWGWGNNLLAYFAERADSYTFYRTDVWIKSIPTLLVAAATFVIIVVLAFKSGRMYCNTICPVGTILGVLSKYSLLKVRLNKSKCNSCGLCAMGCKSSCIDTKTGEIDYSRCVTCFNCIDKCRKGALSYGRGNISRVSDDVASEVGNRPIKGDNAPIKGDNSTSKSDDIKDRGRRDFLAITSLFVGSSVIKAQEMKVDGGLSVIGDKKVPKRDRAITPPGSKSDRNFFAKCTACQLCVSVCPNQVLRPSSDINRFMQPEMSFERGYCRPECTKCSEVCPNGAILPISKADKSSISIGTAHWIEKNCVVLTDGVKCGNCARHCPTGAIQMINRDGREIPAINTARCIGCGACEYVCPSAPFSAIYVEGNSQHREV